MEKIEYWWDIEGDTVIVESDDDRFPVVAIFEYDPNKDGELSYNKAWADALGVEVPFRMGQASSAVEKAEKYIEDLKAGRVTPKRQ